MVRPLNAAKVVSTKPDSFSVSLPLPSLPHHGCLFDHRLFHHCLITAADTNHAGQSIDTLYHTAEDTRALTHCIACNIQTSPSLTRGLCNRVQCQCLQSPRVSVVQCNRVQCVSACRVHERRGNTRSLMSLEAILDAARTIWTA